MEKIPCITPPLALQQQFARVVQDVERIREQQVASGKEIEGLCEGLMARAFAGELVA
jgi:type I restriction enzyme S subunit